MGKLINITGQRFTSLVVLQQVPSRSKASAYWLCRCDCGAETVVAGCKLKSFSTISCGCVRLQRLNRGSNLSHGLSKTRTYRSWKEMRQRCLNPNSDKWKWYGAKGVTVCHRWDSFERFLADMGERPEGMTLDRVNPFGNYVPDNCKWSTQKEQMNNTRHRHLLRTVEKLGDKGHLPWQQ